MRLNLARLAENICSYVNQKDTKIRINRILRNVETSSIVRLTIVVIKRKTIRILVLIIKFIDFLIKIVKS